MCCSKMDWTLQRKLSTLSLFFCWKQFFFFKWIIGQHFCHFRKFVARLKLVKARVLVCLQGFFFLKQNKNNNKDSQVPSRSFCGIQLNILVLAPRVTGFSPLYLHSTWNNETVLNDRHSVQYLLKYRYLLISNCNKS